MTEVFNINVYRDVFWRLQTVLENIARWLEFAQMGPQLINTILAKKASHFRLKRRLKLLLAILDSQYLLF